MFRCDIESHAGRYGFALHVKDEEGDHRDAVVKCIMCDPGAFSYSLIN
jgi:hypothetical protein